MLATAVAIGGPALDTLFIATSRSAAAALRRPGADDDAHELAGALFAVDLAPLGLRGVAEPEAEYM